MADQSYRIINEVIGADKVADLSAKLQLAQQKLQALVDAEKSAVAAGGQFSAATNQAAESVGKLTNELKQAQSSLGRMGDYTTTINQVGYAVDDLQYGFKGIANNIQPILQSIPGMGAWGAIIATGAVVANQLYEKWDKLMGLFGSGGTKTEAERMAELAKQTERSVEAEKEYQGLKERAKHNEAQNKEPEVKTEYKANIDKAIQNAPKAVAEKLADEVFGNHINNIAKADPNYERDHGDAVRKRDDAQRDLRFIQKNDPTSLDIAGAEKRLDDASKVVDSFYGKAREKFLNDLGGEDQKGNVKRLKEAAEKKGQEGGPDAEKLADFGFTLGQADPKKVAAEEKAADLADQEAKLLEDRNKLNKELKDVEEKRLKKEKDAFDKRVAEERKSNKYFDVPEEKRTKEQKEAARLDKGDEDAKARDRTEKVRRTGLARGNMAQWQGQDPELDDEFQKDARRQKKKEDKDAHDLRKQGREDQIEGIDQQMEAVREAKKMVDKRGNSSIEEGGAAINSRVQQGIKSGSDKLLEDQLKALKEIKDAIQKQQKQDDRAARFN